jgi:hypothetical protein
VTLSLGVKRPGCEAGHSPPFSAEVKNAWIYTSTLPIRIHGAVLSLSKVIILPVTFYHGTKFKHLSPSCAGLLVEETLVLVHTENFCKETRAWTMSPSPL